MPAFKRGNNSKGCTNIKEISQPKKIINETHKIYGKLIVIKLIGINYRRQALWECKCECGKSRNVPGDQLRKGVVKSCGCITIERIKKIERNHKPIEDLNFRATWWSYTNKCKKLNIIFNLSEEKFKTLISSECFYCGRIDNTFELSKNRKLKYNGIDRVDNNLGYTDKNSVSCCGTCNKAKTNMSQIDFITWIKTANGNLIKNGY